VFYGTSIQDRSICANLPGGLLAQAFEDSQRGKYKNIVACGTHDSIHMIGKGQYKVIAYTYVRNLPYRIKNPKIKT